MLLVQRRRQRQSPRPNGRPRPRARRDRRVGRVFGCPRGPRQRAADRHAGGAAVRRLGRPVSSGFSMAWEQGATAQLELFTPEAEGGESLYQLKYTPPFRSTLRPPVEQRPLGRGQLDPINAQLEELVGGHQPTTSRSGGRAASTAAANDPTATMELVGSQLFDIVIPRHIGAELRNPGLFLEIGVDEGLLHYPWELMNDGQAFLC